MKQNIHTLLEIPQSPPICDQSLTRLSEDDREVNNQLYSASKPLSISLKRFKNNEILSPEILKSYELSPNLLSGTEISEFNRAKMRLWIAESCHVRKISYQTASLACYILDLYFSNGNKCQLEDFHQFGICCLRIANKMDDNLLILVDFNLFNKERLIQIESSICIKTNFYLNPITFTEIFHSLYHFWSLFKHEIREFIFKGLDQSLKEFKLEERAKIADLEFSFILLHEFLEMVFLILDSFKFGLDQIISNAFYMIFCVQYENHQQILSSSKVLDFIRYSQGPSQIWSLFGSFCQNEGIQLRFGINEDCLYFLYPIYNCLITEGLFSKSLKDEKFRFDPNQEKFRLTDRCLSQTFHFKNKINSFKRYVKRQREQNLRKSSEKTQA